MMRQTRRSLGSTWKRVALSVPAACLLLAATVSGARAQAPWSYDTPIDATTRPAWLDKAVMIGEDAWTPPARTSLKPYIRALRDAGFTVMRLYSDEFRLYPSGASDTWPADFQAEVGEMHTAGMKVIVSIYPVDVSRGARDLVFEHPEWRLRSNDRTPGAPGLACLISPYCDALIERMVSRLKEYDVDGFQLNGWYQSGYCRCDSCKERYKADTGLDVPPAADPSNTAYLRYLVWRDKKLIDRFIQLRKAVKAAKADAVLINCNDNDSAGAYPSSMPEALNCLNDWTNKEWWDPSDDSAVWLLKRLRGSSDDRPAGIQPYKPILHNVDGGPVADEGFHVSIAAALFRAHVVMAMGSIPIYWPGERNEWTKRDSAQAVRALTEFLPYVHETRSLPYAACIDSYTTLQMSHMAPAETARRVGAPRIGIARALMEEHVPFDVISEHNLTAKLLARYRVVVLPNNACMSDRLIQLLRAYVAQGGGLVASFETSLYNRWGERRQDFGLGDLFQASYLSTAPAGPSRIGLSPRTHLVTSDPAFTDLIGTTGDAAYEGGFTRVRALPQALVPLTGLDAEHEKDLALKDWSPLILSEHSGGRVAYFAAAMDAAYLEAGRPYERLLLANAVRWAAKQEPPVRITAPANVQAGFFTKEDASARQTIVHLLNAINSTARAGSDHEQQVAIRQGVTPVMGVRVAFLGTRPNQVYLVPGKTPLAIQQSAKGWEVALPELGQHAVVVAEYPPAVKPRGGK